MATTHQDISLRVIPQEDATPAAGALTVYGQGYAREIALKYLSDVCVVKPSNKRRSRFEVFQGSFEGANLVVIDGGWQLIPVVCQMQCLLDDLNITKFISLGAMQCLAPTLEAGDLVLAKDSIFAVDAFSRMLLKSLFRESVKDMVYSPNQSLLAATMEELKQASAIRHRQCSVVTTLASNDGYLKTQKDCQLLKRGVEAIDYGAAVNYLYSKTSNVQTLAIGVGVPRVDPKAITYHQDIELPATELYDANFSTKVVAASHPLLRVLAHINIG